VFKLDEALERAEKRLAAGPDDAPRRVPRQRSDRGRSRLEPAVLEQLEQLLQERDRLPVRTILERLRERCAALGVRAPARATVYQAIEQIPARGHRIEELPEPVRRTLYNLAATGEVPGRQLAFYCLNYGGLEAVSFAAGMPWLALHQASRMRGWRPRSRGLLDAIRRVRGI
jgi:hypothetical protein